MVNRGLQSLDELDESDRQEAESVAEAQALGGVGVVDWSAAFEQDLGSLD